MIEALTELISELSLLSKTTRAYLEARARVDGLVKPTTGQDIAVAAAVEKPKRTRKETPVDVATPAAKLANRADKTIEDALAGAEKNAEPEMGEKEALDVAYKLAADYISKGEKSVRTEELRKFIRETFKTANTSIAGLKHPQRLQFIAYVKAAGEPAEALA